MIIDAHQHYWRLERGDYHWMSPDMTDLYRDFLPEDLQPMLQAGGVRGTVLVQAAAAEAETRFLLDIAKASESTLGVIGWVDMEAPDVAARLDSLMEHGEGLLKGIRPMIQDIPDPDWILGNSLDRAFSALADRGLVFDALVQPIHLKALEARLRSQPDLRCVINHGAKPDIANRLRSAWSDAMCSLARNTSAVCKLSGLVTEAGENWRASDIKPYVADLLYHFGPGRLVWGSDWPVLNVASDYQSWLDLVRQCCQRLTQAEQDRIFGQNAADLYGLEDLCLQ